MVPCDRPYTKYRKANDRASPIWDEGKTYASREEPSIVRGWKCRRCKTMVPLHGGMPSNAQKHLKNKHDIVLKGTGDSERGEEEDTMSIGSSSQAKSQGQQQLVMRPNIKLFRSSILQWYIERHLPFASIEDHSFRRAMTALNSSVKDYLWGRDARRNWAKDEFVAAKGRMKQMLNDALSKIHISFDIWTSPYSTYAFLGVVAHFITKLDDKTKSQSILSSYLHRLTIIFSIGGIR